MENRLSKGTVEVLNFIAFVCDLITYPVYYFLHKPWEKLEKSKRIKAKPIAADDHSITYRNSSSPGPIHQTLLREKVDTLVKVLHFAVNRYGSAKALGTREIIKEEDEVQPNGENLKKYEMGDYKWITFSEFDQKATAFGAGLSSLGNLPKQPIAIFAETRAEWSIAAHGCFKQNIPIVTIYPTLGEDGVTHCINQTEVSTVITSHQYLPKLQSVLKSAPTVKIIIVMEDQLVKTSMSGFGDSQIIPFNEVLKKGDMNLVSEAVPPVPDDVAIIMFTNGSTGIPKGVMLSHHNIVTTIKVFSDVTEESNGTLIAYLPLAHVYELLTESTYLVKGYKIGYSSPLTLIDTSLKIKKGTKGDASVLKPNAIACVPLILDRIYKGIQAKIANSGVITKILFNFAFAYKLRWSERGFDTPLINRIVFKQTRAMLGGNVSLVISGGAPLCTDTHEFIKTCLCVQLIQGYGLTETTASATVMPIDDMSTGSVGPPNLGCDLRLVDWLEGNYTVKDKPYPRGEILVSGDNVSLEYYKLADKTKEEFFIEDGCRWFRTGDIAEVHPDGSFKIIDRKKDLVKLQAGEYVSLGKVESELKTCPIIDNICVYGDSSKNFCVALVVPNPTQLIQITSSSPGVSFEQLCQDPQAERTVLNELKIHAKRAKLAKFEVPQAVKLCNEVWTPEMGLLTAAFKLKRREIQNQYQKELNIMYGSR